MGWVFNVIALIIISGMLVTGVIVGGTIWGIKKAAGWGKAKVRELKEPEKPRTYAYLDASGNISSDSVRQVVTPYGKDAVLGDYAKAIEETFNKAESRRQAIYSILDAEFEPQSMTWARFSAPVDVAMESIARNSAQMANHLQTFDAKEYQRLDRMNRAGGLEENGTEQEHLALMRETLSKMNDLQAANDRLLLELEKLLNELATMSGSDLGNETDRIAEEIRKLSEDAKYYS